jgi:hypothetical protein
MEHYYLATLILLLVNILMLFLYVRLVRLILSNNKETSEIFIFDKGPIPAIVSLLTVFNLIFFMFSGYILEFINVFVAQ